MTVGRPFNSFDLPQQISTYATDCILCTMKLSTLLANNRFIIQCTIYYVLKAVDLLALNSNIMHCVLYSIIKSTVLLVFNRNMMQSIRYSVNKLNRQFYWLSMYIMLRREISRITCFKSHYDALYDYCISLCSVIKSAIFLTFTCNIMQCIVYSVLNQKFYLLLIEI